MLHGLELDFGGSWLLTSRVPSILNKVLPKTHNPTCNNLPFFKGRYKEVKRRDPYKGGVSGLPVLRSTPEPPGSGLELLGLRVKGFRV